MLRKTSILIALSVFAAAMIFVSCGSKNSGASAGKAPDVEVVSVGTGTGTGVEGGSNGGNASGSTDTVIVINTDNGSLPVNGESVIPASYNIPGAVIVTDEHGTVIVPSIDTSGNISITPADGSASGTYTVVITADGREYVLIIAVDATGTAVVTTSISYPSGSHMVLDIDAGKVKTDIDGNGTVDDFLTLSSISGSNTGYSLDSSIRSFTVKDSSGNTITAVIDSVTGDLITSGNGSSAYIITIVKTDGKIVTIYTDSTGKITSIPVDGMSHVLIPVQNGTAVIVPPTTISGVNISALIPVSASTASGIWSQLSSITGINAFTGENYSQGIVVKIDPLTGSIVTPGLIFAETKVVINETTSSSTATYTILINADGKITSYIKVELKNDGTSISTIILFDENGNIKVYEEKVIKPNGETTTTTVIVNANGTVTVTVINVGVMLRVQSGSISSNGFVLDLTEKPSGLWTLKNGVEIISGMAADGSIPVNSLKITIDPVTGYLLLNGDGTIVPAGPYEIKVRINGSIYIIKSDENGNIETILPGNILLQTAQGFITYNDRDVLKIAEKINNVWSISSQIGSLTAVDSDGNAVNLSIDPYKGNIVTTGIITGPVTITFIYTDAKGNGITYTLVVINGSIYSYTAEITNASPDFDFSTVTNIKVFLNVVDKISGLPLKQASINLASATAANSWVGFTDDSGISVFTATVASASQTTNIAVTHSGYIRIESPITGIGKLIEIGKKIAMTPEEVVTTPVDSDGDGVADVDDEYPGDATGAKKIVGAYTFGFEDQYTFDKVTFNSLVNGMPSGNDADFNDLVVRLSIEEKIDSQNRITKITLKAKTLAAFSGNNNSFGIYVNGIKYIMILKSQVTKNPLVLAAETTLEIPFADGIARNTIGAMPFDPFMVPNGGGTTGINGPNEVHLASVNTTYTGVRKGNGYIKTSATSCVAINGFVWALIIPENWQWPAEGRCIAIAYPTFVNWCNTDGASDYDWFNNFKP